MHEPARTLRLNKSPQRRRETRETREINNEPRKIINLNKYCMNLHVICD